MAIDLRPAVPGDAGHIARVADLASQGLAAYLWRRRARPGEGPWDVGVRRAASDEGPSSWRNG